MNIPEYISKDEVQRVCRELGLQDWTKLTTPEISIDEVKVSPGRGRRRGHGDISRSLPTGPGS